MRYHTVLWDFDGTLVDTEQGIVESVCFACEQMGQKIPEKAVLRKFIGPPLQYSFQTYLGFSEEQAREATRIYREDYLGGRIFLSQPYPGIEKLLQMLCAIGVRNAVTTLKPEGAARCLLERFGFLDYFTVVKGADLQEGHSMTKADAVRYALERIGETDITQAALVGDTVFDEAGAKQCGIDFIAAGYGAGFAAPPECVFYADDVEMLTKFLL